MSSGAIIDHVNAPVSDIAASRDFYLAVLETLGLSILVEEAEVIGFGRDSWDFGIEFVAGAINPLHIAFAAPSEAAVRAFHAAGLASGGVCNGGPGTRPEYGAGYYAAFLKDRDGHNIEAVHRG